MRIPAILLIASVILGLAYYNYLARVSFPPTAVRIVPFIWLLLAGTSFGMTLNRWRRSRPDGTTAVVMALSLLSGLIAVPFGMGALLGG